jgi:hypothetical protein
VVDNTLSPLVIPISASVGGVVLIGLGVGIFLLIRMRAGLGRPKGGEDLIAKDWVSNPTAAPVIVDTHSIQLSDVRAKV